MKFCRPCRAFFEDENTECPDCGKPLSNPIRLAPKPGTPIVPRLISDERLEELRREMEETPNE